VNKINLRVGVVLVATLAVGVWMVANRWKTNDLVIPQQNQPLMPMAGGGLPQKAISRIEFLNSVFEHAKPNSFVARIVTSDPNKVQIDSLEKALKWAMETNNAPLAVLLQTDLALKEKNPNYITICRNLIYNASFFVAEQPMAASYLFQLGKKYLDIGLESDPENIDLLNAQIIYESEFINQPMQFRTTLKKALAVDSNNIETNIIHLNLLKKSGQMGKALKKCEKLISLQPQNPDWLFELSNLYGEMGDSTNAKTYLDLAVKVQKNKQK
jgi:tetratricopeptide (TPR) repeat protein